MPARVLIPRDILTRFPIAAILDSVDFMAIFSDHQQDIVTAMRDSRSEKTWSWTDFGGLGPLDIPESLLRKVLGQANIRDIIPVMDQDIFEDSGVEWQGSPITFHGFALGTSDFSWLFGDREGFFRELGVYGCAVDVLILFAWSAFFR